MRTRNALLSDAERIHQLISAHFATGTLLSRSFPEI
jgi:N-acetylglutamate synthase-like GNAT family acetyltransferase